MSELEVGLVHEDDPEEWPAEDDQQYQEGAAIAVKALLYSSVPRVLAVFTPGVAAGDSQEIRSFVYDDGNSGLWHSWVGLIVAVVRRLVVVVVRRLVVVCLARNLIVPLSLHLFI